MGSRLPGQNPGQRWRLLFLTYRSIASTKVGSHPTTVIRKSSGPKPPRSRRRRSQPSPSALLPRPSRALIRPRPLNTCQKAQLGWQFLLNAISRYGKTGAYQRITHYGDVFTDQDELAWAACEMFLATGDQSIHQKLLSWFDPASPATRQYGWHHLTECYGHAIRSYAFGIRSAGGSPPARWRLPSSRKRNRVVAPGTMSCIGRR